MLKLYINGELIGEIQTDRGLSIGEELELLELDND